MDWESFIHGWVLGWLASALAAVIIYEVFGP